MNLVKNSLIELMKHFIIIVIIILFFESQVYFSGNILNNKNIKLRWVSSLLDFGNNIFEKNYF